jgi:hypothetical protein
MRARTARELSVLHPPSALAPGYRRLVSLIAHEAVLLRRVAEAMRAHHVDDALAAERELRSSAVSHQARLVGLASCA